MTPATFDRNAQKTNQITLVTTIALGYVLQQPALLVIAAGLLAAATFLPNYAPQLLVYRWLVRMNVLPTARVAEDPAPHRFAQLVGLSVLGIALGATAIGFTGIAWGAALLVLFLAVVNLTTGFCAGCFMHAQLARVRAGAR